MKFGSHREIQGPFTLARCTLKGCFLITHMAGETQHFDASPLPSSRDEDVAW